MIRLFISDDEQEIRRIDRSFDMANALFEIQYNADNHVETLQEYKDKIMAILEEHDIDSKELTG